MNEDEGIVRVRFTNVYKFPVIEGNVITSIVRGTKVQILGEEGDFYRVDFGKQVAYIVKACIATAQ